MLDIGTGWGGPCLIKKLGCCRFQALLADRPWPACMHIPQQPCTFVLWPGPPLVGKNNIRLLLRVIPACAGQSLLKAQLLKAITE